MTAYWPHATPFWRQAPAISESPITDSGTKVNPPRFIRLYQCTGGTAFSRDLCHRPVARLREPRGVVWPRSRCYGPPSTGADGRRRHRKTSRPVRRRRAR